MKIISLMLCAAIVSACTAVSSVEQAPGEQSGVIAIPKELTDSVKRSSALGVEIYKHDVAAWKATDLFLHLGVLQSNPNLRGWITERDGAQRYKVTFIGEREGQYLGYYQVLIESGEVSAGSPLINPAGFALDDGQVSKFKARQAAAGLDFMKCSDRYNTVVLDGDAGNHLVYLLASSRKQGAVHSGGNHEVVVSPSGEEILSHVTLSKSCLTMQNDGQAVALTLSHIVTPAPTPVHVFHSLMHSVPLYIVTVENGYIWHVDGDKIDIVDTVTP